ncbi:hypothetical protein ACQ27_gp154 [Klebsiella phage K64-1]|nr:hypothetical protein ACQ27_gp154 [Klebsiella phage K64-1]
MYHSTYNLQYQYDVIHPEFVILFYQTL